MQSCPNGPQESQKGEHRPPFSYHAAPTLVEEVDPNDQFQHMQGAAFSRGELSKEPKGAASPGSTSLWLHFSSYSLQHHVQLCCPDVRSKQSEGKGMATPEWIFGKDSDVDEVGVMSGNQGHPEIKPFFMLSSLACSALALGLLDSALLWLGPAPEGPDDCISQPNCCTNSPHLSGSGW